MLLLLTLFILGLILLIIGADLLVRGVSSIAAALGVPPIVIGMTVVAFGTSLPEVTINVMSAVQGGTGLAFGNIVGSCAINIGFVLALTAIIRPLAVEASMISREIPMLLLCAFSMVVLSLDESLDGAEWSGLTRSDGIMLLLLFGVFLYYTISQLLHSKRGKKDAFIQEVEEQIKEEGTLANAKKDAAIRGKDIAMLIGGIVGVAVGGRMTVMGAVGIAERFGIPQAVIGLTIVSFGTTLPELATCIQAARRGQADIAIGNIVGSNIFNLLWIGGIVSTISPIPMPEGGASDLIVMTGLCTLLLPIALRANRTITRGEGGFLLVTYLSYIIYRSYGVISAL